MNKNKYLILFLCMFSSFIFCKRIGIKKKLNGVENFKDKNWLNAHAWFKIIPLQEILKNNPSVVYKKVMDKVFFDCPKFSISPQFPHKGYFDELFILEIPHARVQGEQGYVFINGKLSDEMARADYFEALAEIPRIEDNKVKRVKGKVAVIAQQGSGQKHSNYYHWTFEVLGRLAMLEIAGIEYDYVYVGQSKKFMRETLELWGIDSSKIIAPTDDNFCIEADELIVPSLVINTSCRHKHAGNFQHPITSDYVRSKLLEAAKAKNIDISKFSKRIFISRKDAYNARRILNEDEIFKLLQEKSFESYELSKLSVIEQIILFNNAEIIVSEQGSGLTNILFCNPETKVIEIFQALIDNCFWWISQMLKLNYIPIETMVTDVDYFANWKDRNFSLLHQSFFSQIDVPLDSIKKVMAQLDVK